MHRLAKVEERVVNPLSHVLEKCTHTMPHLGRMQIDRQTDCIQASEIRAFVTCYSEVRIFWPMKSARHADELSRLTVCGIVCAS